MNLNELEEAGEEQSQNPLLLNQNELRLVYSILFHRYKSECLSPEDALVVKGVVDRLWQLLKQWQYTTQQKGET